MLVKQKSNNKRFFKLVAAASVFLFIIGLFYVVVHSPVFNIVEVDTNNLYFYDAEMILPSLERSTVKNSKTLAMLGSDNIITWIFSDESKLLADLSQEAPLIQSINIDTDVVNKKVTIRIEENKNIKGVICTVRGDCYAFDPNGLIFAKAPNVIGSLILKIEDKNSRLLTVGNRIFPDRRWTQTIFQTLSELGDLGYSVNSVSVYDFSLKEWIVDLRSGPVLHLSLERVPDNLVGVIQSLDNKLDLDSTTYIDLRVEGRIYYK